MMEQSGDLGWQGQLVFAVICIVIGLIVISCGGAVRVSQSGAKNSYEFVGKETLEKERQDRLELEKERLRLEYQQKQSCLIL